MRYDGLERFEGDCINMTLADGSRLEECEVVSAGREGGTVWLDIGGLQTFVPASQITEVAATSPDGSGRP